VSKIVKVQIVDTSALAGLFQDKEGIAVVMVHFWCSFLNGA
jgi:hypothetical protein